MRKRWFCFMPKAVPFVKALFVNISSKRITLESGRWGAPLLYSWNKINNLSADKEVSWSGKSHNRQLPCLIWRLIDWLSSAFDLFLPDFHQEITPPCDASPWRHIKTTLKALCTFSSLHWSSDSRKSEGAKWFRSETPLSLFLIPLSVYLSLSLRHTFSNSRTQTHTHTHIHWKGCKRRRELCNGGEEWVCSVRLAVTTALFHVWFNCLSSDSAIHQWL